MFKRIIAISIMVLACIGASAKKEQSLNVVPRPAKVELGKGSFKIKGANFNYGKNVPAEAVQAIGKLADRLYVATGKSSTVSSAAGTDKDSTTGKLKGVFFFCDPSLPAEGYSIEICPKAIKVCAPDKNGFLYALQTIRQMLPASVYSGGTDSKSSWRLPCCRISDAPRFAYRGLMLDCCRHFFSVDEVKKILDLMAMYKLNTMHWHLSEDQGWRIEISRYPKLTEIGAYRDGTQVKDDRNRHDGVRYGGYYTKEQVAEIVKYAGNLGITIIPEIDLPGHMLGALAAYPQLGCTGGPYSVWTRWGISKDVLCIGKEETFDFIFGVLDEICEMFPSEYIHIGGDECPKDAWKVCPRCQARIAELGLKSDEHASKEQRLQNYVTSRVQAHLAAKGRKIIGWDEILEGDLSEGATVMSWRGTAGGIKAAKKGFDVVMTPKDYCYFDYVQSPNLDKEPWTIAGARGKRVIPLEKVYNADPLAGFEPGTEDHILGVQANMWTEFIADNATIEYMLIPRLLALSEVQWSPAEGKDYPRFLKVLADWQLPLLKGLGYNYRPLD